MWGRIGTLTPINIIFYLRSYLVVLLSQKEGHWKDEWPTVTRIHCVWTNMGHSRTIFIVAVILRSVRYSKLHTGELACQQILFIETCGREKKSSPALCTIQCRFPPLPLFFWLASVLFPHLLLSYIWTSPHLFPTCILFFIHAVCPFFWHFWRLPTELSVYLKGCSLLCGLWHGETDKSV